MTSNLREKTHALSPQVVALVHEPPHFVPFLTLKKGLVYCLASAQAGEIILVVVDSKAGKVAIYSDSNSDIGPLPAEYDFRGCSLNDTPPGKTRVFQQGWWDAPCAIQFHRTQTSWYLQVLSVKAVENEALASQAIERVRTVGILV